MWFYLALLIGFVLAVVIYLQVKEAEMNRRYLKAKLDAKLQVGEPKKKPLMSDDSSSDDSEVETSSSGRVGGAKEEIAKAEVVMRSNSSYVDLGHNASYLTKRMKDD